MIHKRYKILDAIASDNTNNNTGYFEYYTIKHNSQYCLVCNPVGLGMFDEPIVLKVSENKIPPLDVNGKRLHDIDHRAIQFAIIKHDNDNFTWRDFYNQMLEGIYIPKKELSNERIKQTT